MIQLEIKRHNGANTLKSFDNMPNALKYLSEAGYVYDEIDKTYWAVSPAWGWLTTAPFKKPQRFQYKEG